MKTSIAVIISIDYNQEVKGHNRGRKASGVKWVVFLTNKGVLFFVERFVSTVPDHLMKVFSFVEYWIKVSFNRAVRELRELGRDW